MSFKIEKSTYGVFPPEIWLEIPPLLATRERILLAAASSTMASLVYHTPTTWAVVRFDDEASKSITPLINILGKKLPPACKAVVRYLLLDGTSIQQTDAIPLLRQFINIEELSFRNCQHFGITDAEHVFYKLSNKAIYLKKLNRVLLRDTAIPSSLPRFFNPRNWHPPPKVGVISYFEKGARAVTNGLTIEHDLDSICNGCPSGWGDTDPAPCRMCQKPREDVLCPSCGTCANCEKRALLLSSSHSDDPVPTKAGPARFCVGCVSKSRCQLCRQVVCTLCQKDVKWNQCQGCALMICGKCYSHCDFAQEVWCVKCRSNSLYRVCRNCGKQACAQCSLSWERWDRCGFGGC